MATLLSSSMCVPRVTVRYDRRPPYRGEPMSRLSPLDEANLAPDARAYLDALNSGPRGKIGLIGPFGVWAHAPKIGNAAQAFGGAVRFQTTLPERIKEIAI